MVCSSFIIQIGMTDQYKICAFCLGGKCQFKNEDALYIAMGYDSHLDLSLRIEKVIINKSFIQMVHLNKYFNHLDANMFVMFCRLLTTNITFPRQVLDQMDEVLDQYTICPPCLAGKCKYRSKEPKYMGSNGKILDIGLLVEIEIFDGKKIQIVHLNINFIPFDIDGAKLIFTTTITDTKRQREIFG